MLKQKIPNRRASESRVRIKQRIHPELIIMDHQDSMRRESHTDYSTPGSGLKAKDTSNIAVVRVAGHVRDD